MSKLFKMPASRLICFGGAKLATNGGTGEKDELDNGDKFN